MRTKTNCSRKRSGAAVKLTLYSFVFCFISSFTYSQDFITFYIPGYQFAGMKATNVIIDHTGARGDAKGHINNLLAKGDGIAGNYVFGIDVTQVMVSLANGFKTNGKSIYGDGFSLRLGYAVNVAEATKVGLGFDIGFRGVQYYKDTVSIESNGYNFWYMGATLTALHSIGEKIYIMPKLSFDPILGPDLDKMTRGLSTKFEVSLGYRLGGKFGVSITPGFENMKFLYKKEVANDQFEIKKSSIKTKFLQVGISFMLN